MQISSLSSFIEWANQLGSGNYLFRGVPNAEYKIQASAYRRLKEGAGNLEFLQINRDLIADARLRGHGERDGRELGDLEILAQLQHFGAATCLIDFTRNAQVALYFACQKDNKWEKNSQDSERGPDGKVYAVRNDQKRFEKITPDSLEKNIDKFLQINESNIPQLYCWEPGYRNNRIIAQQSIFVFGAYEFDESNTYVIKESCKEHILIELEQITGINEAMLFPDFDGFARLHGEDIPYTEPSVLEYMRFGFQAYQAKQQELALVYFDTVLKRDPNNLYLNHLVQGESKYKQAQYQEAMTEFDKMIKIAPNNSYGHRFRGLAKEQLGQLEEAGKDFRRALTLAQQVGNTGLIDEIERDTQRIQRLIKERT